MMSKTMVEVFNQLTHSELADYSLFEQILGDHFEKFRSYYYSVSDIPASVTKTVKSVSCFCTDNGIVIVTDFKTSKNCTDYVSHLECDEHEYSGYFSFTTEITGGKKLNISIENKSISREDEIYENRFNSH